MDRKEPIRRGQARQIIEATILSKPGLSKSELRAATGLAWGTIWYHLQALERLGQLRMIARSGQVHVFPAGLHERRMRWLALLRHDSAKQLLEVLAARRQLTISEASRTLGLSTTSSRNLLKELVEVGLAETHGTGRPRFLACSETITIACEAPKLASFGNGRL